MKMEKSFAWCTLALALALLAIGFSCLKSVQVSAFGGESDANKGGGGTSATCDNNYYTGACGDHRGGLVFTIEERGTVIPGNGASLPTIVVDGPDHLPYYVTIRLVNTKTGELGPVADMNLIMQGHVWDSLPGYDNVISKAEAIEAWAKAYNIAVQNGDWDVLKYGLLAMFLKSDLGMFGYITDEEILALLNTPTPPSQPPETITCPIIGGDADINYGNTAALSAVRNLSSNVDSEWKTTGGGEYGGYNYTWARPGDSVIFRHSLCFGAQKVTQGTSNGRSPYANQANTFIIESSRSEKYAFEANNSLFNHWITLSLNDPYPSAVSQADSKSPYAFTVYSPSVKPSAGSTYSCDVSVYQLNAHIVPGFQIPGFVTPTGSCNASNKTGNTNEAGQKITQTLKYNIVRSFIKDQTKVSGTCSGHDHDAASIHLPSASKYWEAKGNAPEWGYAVRYTVGDRGCNYHDKYDPDYDDPTATPPIVKTWVDYYYTWDQFWRYDALPDNEAGPFSAQVEVKIPFNFDTAVSSSVNSDPVFPGESVRSHFSWDVLPRSNPTINQNPYATIVPDYAEVRIVEFTIPAGVSESEANVAGSIDGRDPCSYFGYADCHTLDSITFKNNPTGLNLTGSYNGDSGAKNYDRTVPDVEVGTKYCVAIGFYPVSSHRNAGQSGDEGMYNQTDNRWNIGGASCSPIAKKPSFQAWGAGVYTKGSINTSVSKKQVNAGFGNYDASKTTYFGSWDEFAVIPLGSVKGFASASGLGYYASTQVQGGASHSSKYCDVSKLTITKPSCDDGSGGGNSKISITSTIADRFKARYTSDEAPKKDSGYTVTQDAVNNEGEYYKLGSGVRYFRVNGDVNINSILMTGGTGRDTLVIHATGTAKINDNICYGDRTCDYNNQGTNYLRSGNFIDEYGTISSIDEYINYLRDYLGIYTDSSSYNQYMSTSTRFSDIAALPQVLIFADNIVIDQNVSQIDGWLIASKTINTCGQFVEGSTDADTCNKTLTVNGPVYAGDLALNRTAGALPGGGTNESTNPAFQNLANDGSITPGEIFNLRPDTYYWAYSQAQRYSQAVVTYIRELAPRY